MKPILAMAIALFTALASVLYIPSGAASEHGRALELREAGEILPLEAILEKARAAQSGQLLEAELEKEHGRLVYELELLGDDGHYYELYLDAKTGDILKHERE